MGQIASVYARTHETKNENSASRMRKTGLSQPMKSPADRILFLQRTIGNQAVQRLIKSGALQAKLTVNPPGDIYEQEADRMAYKVINMPVQEPEEGESMMEPHTQSCAACVQKANNTGMPDNLKAGIENFSGIAMDDVKVHYNSDKPARLDALAYTQGMDIHVAPGQERHLPHEGWHAVQQAQGRVKPTMQMEGEANINDDVGLEDEATRMGNKAVQMKLLANNCHQACKNTQLPGMTDILPLNRTPMMISPVIQRAIVVRGGTCLADQFEKGAESKDIKTGKLYGVSTSSDIKQPGDLNLLGNTVFNKQIGVANSSDIEKIGGKCNPTPSKSNPWHTDLNELTGTEASKVFIVQSNPNPKQI